MNLQLKIIEKSKELGFELIGFSNYRLLVVEVRRLNKWLADGFNAGMGYMQRNIEKKLDPRLMLDSAKSIISLGINYYNDVNYPSNTGKVSKYAVGKDYHDIISDKIYVLTNYISSLADDFQFKICVDSGPSMDKVWAVESGLGWLGKNNNVINSTIGSWFFIANIFSNLELSPSPRINDHCGTCDLCIRSCPTKAIVEPYIIDANLCISYQTIENKSDIPNELYGKFEDWAFGCDICQDVCPWNKKLQQESTEPSFSPENIWLSSGSINNLSEIEFKSKYQDSPIKRARLKGIKRNLEFINK